ncbi:MAG: hypothetical protein IT431_17915 [Phycisphaerales bacterium]|nr:hypothetical protein [Phycisphaerales bacterium]
MTPDEDSRRVYSTEGGRVREEPRKAASKAAPPPQGMPDDGIVRIMRDRKGRGGKTATTIHGLSGSDAELDVLLKRLKQVCGAGGSREGRVLVVQGDHRERLQADLEKLGHRVKLAGG